MTSPQKSSPAKGNDFEVLRTVENSGLSCQITLPDGTAQHFGPGEPQFAIHIKNESVLKKNDVYSLANDFVNGDYDVSGDFLEFLGLRKKLKKAPGPVFLLKLWLSLLFKKATAINKKAIDYHYTIGDDFFLAFMDKKHRLYSHCLFPDDSSTLEQAATHKMETMYRALELKAGKRLLDIGCGWGPIPEYCGPKGVQVVSLTIADDSVDYTNKMIEAQGIAHQCKVLKQDFLTYEPEQLYDAIVIYGVIEHIPYYKSFARQVWRCLKPGGRLYLDGSAVRKKFDVSNFTRKHIWPGTHSYMCLQELIQELLFHGMDILDVVNETHDYGLTMHHWARRLEESREAIVEQYGKRWYRLFQIYLWGGSHAFLREGSMQAYHLVAKKSPQPGPRPGLMKRFTYFIRQQI